MSSTADVIVVGGGPAEWPLRSKCADVAWKRSSF